MYPQDNPYMVKTQLFTTRGRTRQGDFGVHLEDSMDTSAEDVHSEDLHNEDLIYYELQRSCDDGFWHDTADTIVSNWSKHLSDYQKARLQQFVLTIAKRVFQFSPVSNPSLTYNLAKGSHRIELDEKYHVIVRKEQNIVHIFACTDEFINSEEDNFKQCAQKDALGLRITSDTASDTAFEEEASEIESVHSFDPDKEHQKQVLQETQRAEQSREAGAAARALARGRAVSAETLKRHTWHAGYDPATFDHGHEPAATVRAQEVQKPPAAPPAAAGTQGFQVPEPRPSRPSVEAQGGGEAQEARVRAPEQGQLEQGGGAAHSRAAPAPPPAASPAAQEAREQGQLAQGGETRRAPANPQPLRPREAPQAAAGGLQAAATPSIRGPEPRAPRPPVQDRLSRAKELLRDF
jgi:hypothetical protein